MAGQLAEQTWLITYPYDTHNHTEKKVKHTKKKKKNPNKVYECQKLSSQYMHYTGIATHAGWLASLDMCSERNRITEYITFIKEQNAA